VTRWQILPVLAAMLVVGCAKRAPDHTQAPSERQDGAAGETDLAMLEQQLAAREAQLRSAGVAVDTDALAMKAQTSGASEGDSVGEAAEAPSSTSPSTPPQPAAAGADPSAPSRPTARSEERGGRCMQVCDISAAICTLQDQICDLRQRHADDPRYQSVCDRAVADCQLSTEACHGCSDT
jgi:hypothetical protein